MCCLSFWFQGGLQVTATKAAHFQWHTHAGGRVTLSIYNKLDRPWWCWSLFPSWSMHSRKLNFVPSSPGPYPTCMRGRAHTHCMHTTADLRSSQMLSWTRCAPGLTEKWVSGHNLQPWGGPGSAASLSFFASIASFPPTTVQKRSKSSFPLVSRMSTSSSTCATLPSFSFEVTRSCSTSSRNPPASLWRFGKMLLTIATKSFRYFSSKAIFLPSSKSRSLQALYIATARRDASSPSPYTSHVANYRLVALCVGTPTNSFNFHAPTITSCCMQQTVHARDCVFRNNQLLGNNCIAIL